MSKDNKQGQDGAGDDSSLAVTPQLKKSVARYMDDELEPAFAKAGRGADKTSDAVSGENGNSGTISKWETGKGVAHCSEEWEQQVKDVRQLLHDQMRALRSTGNLFQGQDGKTGDGFDLRPPQGPILPTHSRPRSVLDDL